jgi:sugar-specific transcriptional regulator TrmB
LDFEEHIQLLCELGLTPIQAKMYLWLLGSGGHSASSVADVLKINRVDVYRGLRKLQQLGIVELNIGKPNTFSAVQPKIALKLLVDLRRKELNELDRKADYLTKTLESINEKQLVNQVPLSENQYFRLKNGEAVVETLSAMIKQAKHQVRKMLTSKALSFHLLYGIFDIERDLYQKGVEIKLVTDVPSETLTKYESISNIHYIGDLSNTLRYVIVDDSQIIISLAADAIGPTDSVGLLTNNKTLIHALTKHFEETWSMTSGKS